MKRFLVVAAAVQLLNLSTSQPLYAQKCVNPHFDAQRLDFRDLGYPGATEIAADASPITALAAHSNGKAYGATSGKRSHLFVWDARVNKVFPLGQLPETQKGVRSCLAEGKDGLLYVGSGLNETELLRLSREMPEGRRAIEHQLWRDIENRYRGFEGGHLYAYDPKKSDAAVYLEGAKAVIEIPFIPEKPWFAKGDGNDVKPVGGTKFESLRVKGVLFGAAEANPAAGTVRTEPAALKLAFAGNRVVAVSDGAGTPKGAPNSQKADGSEPRPKLYVKCQGEYKHLPLPYGTWSVTTMVFSRRK